MMVLIIAEVGEFCGGFLWGVEKPGFSEFLGCS